MTSSFFKEKRVSYKETNERKFLSMCFALYRTISNQQKNFVMVEVRLFEIEKKSSTLSF